MSDTPQGESNILNIRVAVPAWAFRGDSAQPWSALVQLINAELGQCFATAMLERYGETEERLQSLAAELPQDAPGLEIHRTFVVMTPSQWTEALAAATQDAYLRGYGVGMLASRQLSPIPGVAE